jgi:predicted nucleic-acid-binding protein
MEIVDANIVLRYLLNDHKKFYDQSKHIIERKTIHLATEVLAEIVYVLEKVYNVPRNRIFKALTQLLDYPNITTSDKMVYFESLNIYKTENIDFVDALLVSYNRVHNYTIHSFDKKVQKLCNSNRET